MASLLDQAKKLASDAVKNTGSFINNAPAAIGKYASQQILQPAVQAATQPFRDVGQATESYAKSGDIPSQFVQNRVINPAKQIFASQSTPLQRIGGALQTVGNIMSPAYTAGYAALDAAKGAAYNYRMGANPLQGAKQGVIGNMNMGLGTALTNNKLLAGIGNVAEVAAPFSGDIVKAGLKVKNFANFVKGGEENFAKSQQLENEARVLMEKYRNYRAENPHWSENNATLKNLRNTIEGNLKKASELRNSGSSMGGQVAGLVDKKQIGNTTSEYNVGRNDTQNKQILKQSLDEVAPAFEKVAGKPLSHKEILNKAQTVSGDLIKTIGRAKTEELGAAQLRIRQNIARMADEGKVTPELLQAIKTDAAFARSTAQLLGQRAINAAPSTEGGKMQVELIKNILKVSDDTDKILEAAKGVDFNDAKQSAEFYRKFVKPNASEWMDLLRYNSMLSSPNTHINNAFSNLGSSAVIAPIEKTVAGTIDWLGSTATGKDRKAFAGEGGAYSAGYFKSLGKATDNFINHITGKSLSGNLDTRDIPLATKGVKGMANQVLGMPMKLLEASDQFFTTLTEGGEKAALKYRASKGVQVGDINKIAHDKAAYRLYRQDLFKEGQGTVLDAIDQFTSKVQSLRNNKNPIVSTISKFTIPFLKTPMNILKQGVEYSPAGLATLYGNSNKTEQLSKAIVGSSAMAATAMLVSSGRTTWAAPTDQRKKDAFYGAGMQPYAIKVGDKWISYTKLPPQLSFPIALVSALHEAQQEKKLSQNDLDVILGTIAKSGNFFADQSYLKSIGDTLAAVKGSPEQLTQLIGNYPQQLVPFRALSGWLARITDPMQRKVNTDASFLEQQTQQLMTQIPGLSQQVPARTDLAGNPVPNENRVTNAFSPLKVTTEKPQQKQRFDALQDFTKIKSDLKEGGQKTQPERIQEIESVMKSSTPEQKKKYLSEGLKNGTIQVADLKALVQQKIDKAKGVPQQLQDMKSQSAPVRAVYIKQQLAGMTPDEKKKYIVQLKTSGVLTTEVIKEIIKQKKGK